MAGWRAGRFEESLELKSRLFFRLWFGCGKASEAAVSCANVESGVRCCMLL